MNNLKNKKDEADILSNFGPILLSALVVLILIILFGSWMANFEKKDAVNQITRKYILKMETTGGLTDADKTDLLKELEPYCENVVLEFDGKKTTKEGEAKYGETIDLYVKADLFTYKFTLLGDRSTQGNLENGSAFQLVNEDGEVDGNPREIEGTSHTKTITIHRSSTSKH